MLATATFAALGATATVCCTDPARLDEAAAVVVAGVAAMDLAASRFRPDSELSSLGSGGGSRVVSPLLHRAVAVAARAAALTGGVVDPTLGGEMVAWGYDRDFEQIAPDGPPVVVTLRARPAWPAVVAHPDGHSVTLPPGCLLDLGATAKALCADLAAASAWAVTGAGVLVDIGGDVSVAGPAPEGGWVILASDDRDQPLGPDASPQVVTIRSGGVATSGVTARRWTRGGRPVNHLLDPRTGAPVDGPWRAVSVAAGNCVDANTASTAAMVLGHAAPAWLEQRGMPARLVAGPGRVVTTAGWPEGAPVLAGAPC